MFIKIILKISIRYRWNNLYTVYYAENLTKKLGGAKILFKQEHLNHTGSHKITNSLFQILLAKRMGKSHLICESGAGQHYSATAAVAAKFNRPPGINNYIINIYYI